MSLETGSQLGRYKIISQLGRGGMGEVYLAEDTKLERTVALKVLPPDVSNNQQRMNRFAREARAASKLNHPNVAHIYEIEITETPCYIAMEYIKGETLREYLSKNRLTLHEALDIAVQVTRAVAAAHAAGIVHRDIKTENIMISRDGYVKVLDFGLAKLIEPTDENPDPAALTVTSGQTDPGVVMGTFSYMSPEQARGFSANARTDLWSLGVVIYEMVAGQLPFTGRTASDLLSSILKDEPPPLARFARDVPEALEWIVVKALTKDVEGRYQTAAELLSDLQRLKNRLGAEAEIERSLPPEYRISRSSSAGVSQAPLRLSTASSTHAPVTNSVHPQSSAEYVVGGIKRHKRSAIVVLILLAVAAGATAIFFLRNRTTQFAAAQSTQHRSLSRVTTDAGLQIGATWSQDARLIAYSSDRSGNFDIWVQPLGGGNPIQVTHHPAHDWQPDWSPDGNNIVFRSERDGGGLYIVPAFGGNERRVASLGYRPQWSPDGSKILFLEPSLRLFDFPKVYYLTLDSNDAAPHEIATSINGTETGIRENSVAWHPDGKRISFLNMDGTFWTVPLAGGAPVKSEIAPKVASQLKEADVELSNFRWALSGKFLYFEGTSRGVPNIWRVTVEPDTLRWIDGPEQLTTDNEQDTNLSISRDGKHLAYTISTQSTRIWLLPFDSNSGQIKGQGQPITDKGMEVSFSDLSPDGKKFAFISHMYGVGRQELHVKSLADKQENLLAADDNYRYYPRWSPDSTRLAYSRFHSIDQQTSGDAGPPLGATKAGPIVMLDTRRGEEQLITSQGPWLDYMYDWSPDGEWILASTNRASKTERWEICLFPLRAAPHAEDEVRVVASDPENSLWTPRFSPDGRWICYIAQKAKEASTSIIYVVPSSGGTPARITGENSWCDWPRWSGDGKTIYFVSNYNSSFLNVWGIHFDPAQGVAVGEPFRVTNFESPGQMISTKIAFTEMSMNKNRLALPVTDVSGSIWMLDNVDR